MHTDIRETLPQEDLRWLRFVQRFDRILEDHPTFVPLRRFVYTGIYETTRPAPAEPAWRIYPRYVKQFGFSLRNRLALKKADVLIWQDVERAYMYRIVNVLLDMLDQRGRSSALLIKESLTGERLARVPLRIYPDAVSALPPEANRFAKRVVDAFGEESQIDLKPHVEAALRQFYGYTRVFRRVIDAVEPRAVIFTYDQFLPSATLADLAGARGASTFVLQHGAANPFQYPLQAGRLLAWGEQDKQYYQRLGMPESAIRVVGSILHDGFVPRKNTRPRKNRILLLSNGNNTDRNGDLPRIAYDWLRRLQEEHPAKYQIFVRYHPGELEVFKTLGTAFDQSLNGVAIDAAISEADLVVGYVSTALLESVLLGRPVLQLLDPGGRRLCDFWEHGVTTAVRDYDDFKKRIHTVCADTENYEAVVRAQGRRIHQYFHNYSHARTATLDQIDTAMHDTPRGHGDSQEYQ